MTRSQKILFIALAAFIGSFFLTAVRTADVLHLDIPGYFCALSTFFSPWSKDGLQDLSTKPVEYFAGLFSGLINPLFLAAIVMLQRKKTQRLGKKLRVIVLLMLPSCWLYFLEARMYPNVGYFLWIGAMLTALFATSFSRGRHMADPAQSKKNRPEKLQDVSAQLLS
jgi:hypothetical protein